MNKLEKNLIILILTLFVIAAWEFIFLLDKKIILNVINQSDIIKNVIINLISPAIIAICLLIVFNCLNPFESRNEKHAITVYDNHTNVKWDKLIVGAKKIDISVVFYDRWFFEHQNLLVDFFENGGKLRIVLPNIKNEDVISYYEPFFPSYNKETLKQFIKKTSEDIEYYYDKYRESYLIAFSDIKMNYFLCLIDEKYTAFSHYESNKNTGGKSPFFIFERSQMTFNFNQFWEDEFQYLFDVLSSKEVK